MNLAIASGKGGTGKTTIATNLASSLYDSGKDVLYIDCDVEEPNGHIFLKPKIENGVDITVGVPLIDLDKCNGCGRCAQLCQYSAIIHLIDKPIVFEDMCHSCGGCMRICPQNAITEVQRKIGIAEFGSCKAGSFVGGKIDIGAIQTPAVIKFVKKNLSSNYINIIDAPPGTSCPVITAIKDSDFVLLVTEPTPFGLNDLKLAVGMMNRLKMPFAVVINRCDIGNDDVLKYCRKEDIEVFMQITNNREIAEYYSRGIMLAQAMKGYKEQFINLYEKIRNKLEEI